MSPIFKIIPDKTPDLRTCITRRWPGGLDLQTSLVRLRPISVVRDGNDGAFALVAEVSNANQETALTLHHVDAAGVKSGSVTLHSAPGTVWIYQAFLVPSASGSCIAVWTWGAWGAPIRAQRYNSSLTGLWTSPVALSPSAFGYDWAGGVSDGQGGAFVAFDEKAPGPASRMFRLQHVTMSGALPWGTTGTTLVSGTTAQNPYVHPRLAVGPAEVAVVWYAMSLPPAPATAFAAWVDFNGQTIAPPFSIGTTIESLGQRWVAADPGGGFYVALNPVGNPVTLTRFDKRSTTPKWTVQTKTLAKPGALSLVEDGAGGALLATVNTGNAVSLGRYNQQGANLWQSATASNVGTATLIFPGLPYGPVPWVSPIVAAARIGGGALLVYTDWQQPTLPTLHARCFDPNGTFVGKDNAVAINAGAHMFPLLADVVVPSAPPPSIVLGGKPVPIGRKVPFDPLAGSIVCIWQSASGAAGTVVSAQKLGCCSTTYSGTRVIVPDLGCATPIDWPLSIPSTVHAAFPCGREGAGTFGLMPLPHLASLPGAQLPGGLATPSVPVPDWVRITFEHAPPDVSIEIRSHENALVAKAKPVEGLPGLTHGKVLAVTFKPVQSLSYVLVFNRPKRSTGESVVPLGVRIESGNGRPPALPTIQPPSAPSPAARTRRGGARSRKTTSATPKRKSAKRR